jgi:serine/threonine-protein kinase RsbT
MKGWRCLKEGLKPNLTPATTYQREVRALVIADADILTARQRGREIARELEFSPAGSTMVATAISELARNIVRYAGRGEIVIDVAEGGARRGIEIFAHDDGPGIRNIDEVMQGADSTS